MKSILQWAELLNGRQYRNEITPDESIAAKENNIVIVFGASDDLMEFRGAIDDELGCFEGCETYINAFGIVENQCPDDDCPYFQAEKRKGIKIEAIWDRDGYSFVFETKIPHETFNIMEDNETYCRGIVFSLDALEV